MTHYEPAPPDAFGFALHAASVYFGEPVTRAYIRERTKRREVVYRRFFVMAYMRWHDPKKLSFPVIARILGMADHTSVMHGVRKARAAFPDAVFCRTPGPGPDSTIKLPEGIVFSSALPCMKSGAGVQVALS